MASHYGKGILIMAIATREATIMAINGTVNRALEDRAAITFRYDGNNEECLIANCQNPNWAGTSQVIEVRALTRDTSTLVINLVYGGPPIHVTVTDPNGITIPPSQYGWSSGLGASASITADATGYLFQAIGNGGGLQHLQASNNNGTIVGPSLIVNFVAPEPNPTEYLYTSP